MNGGNYQGSLYPSMAFLTIDSSYAFISFASTAFHDHSLDASHIFVVYRIYGATHIHYLMALWVNDQSWNDGKFGISLFTKDGGAINCFNLDPVRMLSSHHGYRIRFSDYDSGG